MRDDDRKTLTDDEITTAPMGRRSALGVLGRGVLGGGVLAASVTAVGIAGTTGTAHAIAGCTDRDPSDPAGNGRGRGISDSDPRDPAGCGSRACSDSDPNDPAGRGRHC